MRELSLFSGAGGGLLGTYLLGWQPVGYVEWDDYCQRVIAARIADGILPAAPIFGDIRAFTSDGYAAAYTGLVDVITGGFPCQPFSVAGKRAGADDERNMWPAIIECIRVVRPRFCLLENVPGLLTSGYFGTVLGDLAESGYDVRWRVLSAAEVGAPHERKRLWIVADSRGSRCSKPDTVQSASHSAWNDTPQEQSRKSKQGQPVTDREVADSHEERRNWRTWSEWPRWGAESTNGSSVGNIICKRFLQWQGVQENTCQEQQTVERTGRQVGRNLDGGSYWQSEPDVGRVAHGVAARVDRLRALGNGQVPAVVRAAWLLLNEVVMSSGF